MVDSYDSHDIPIDGNFFLILIFFVVMWGDIGVLGNGIENF